MGLKKETRQLRAKWVERHQKRSKSYLWVHMTYTQKSSQKQYQNAQISDPNLIQTSMEISLKLVHIHI